MVTDRHAVRTAEHYQRRIAAAATLRQQLAAVVDWLRAEVAKAPTAVQEETLAEVRRLAATLNDGRTGRD